MGCLLSSSENMDNPTIVGHAVPITSIASEVHIPPFIPQVSVEKDVEPDKCVLQFIDKYPGSYDEILDELGKKGIAEKFPISGPVKEIFEFSMNNGLLTIVEFLCTEYRYVVTVDQMKEFADSAFIESSGGGNTSSHVTPIVGCNQGLRYGMVSGSSGRQACVAYLSKFRLNSSYGKYESVWGYKIKK